MTQEDRNLLLKDLCPRLLYNVVIRCTDNDTDYKCFLTTGILNELLHNTEYYDYKPYLRPMSSMTEEEIEEYRNLSDEVIGSYGPYHHEFIAHCVRLGIKPDNPHECVDNFLNMEAIDWLNAHHFDYRGLIEKGLALEAPEDMYKTS